MAADVFTYRAGRRPLLVSVPHDGRQLAPGMAERMTDAGRALPDTDWHVARLYEFAAELGASLLVANYSRYVVDLNRPADDAALYPGQLSTGLCPTETFAGEAIYRDASGLPAGEIDARRDRYWRPYHDRIAAALESMREQHGYALLWDAHSIASEVPRLFEGELPVLNVGSNGGASAAAEIVESVSRAAADSGHSFVVDGRFRGGYITRHYGRPEARVHALQLEIAQRGYMDEATCRYDDDKAAALAATVGGMLDACATAAAGLYR
jgi:N-formylglutamate deformylase